MNVLLVYAKSKTLAEQAAGKFGASSHADLSPSRDEIYPPLGITILAAWLEERGHEVRLCDDSVDSEEEIRAHMLWANVVGISALTANARRARELGRIAKQELGRSVILGGPHPTTNPEFFLEAGAADVCVRGEGDFTLPELLEVIRDASRWHGVKGVVFMENGGMVRTDPRPLVTEMDRVP